MVHEKIRRLTLQIGTEAVIPKVAALQFQPTLYPNLTIYKEDLRRKFMRLSYTSFNMQKPRILLPEEERKR